MNTRCTKVFALYHGNVALNITEPPLFSNIWLMLSFSRSYTLTLQHKGIAPFLPGGVPFKGECACI